MQNIWDIHDYDEHFTDQFIEQTLCIYDRWNIRPMQNDTKILADGTNEDINKFIDFMNQHSSKDHPVPIVIVVGNTEKNNPEKMLNKSMRYFKLKFDKFSGNDLGAPLMMNSPLKYQTGQEQLMPLGFSYNQKQSVGGIPQSISYNDIQGIVDRNVSDATRSIRAEYEEVNAKREAESIKRLAELETKMELYKLDIRAREVEEKERRLQEELDEFERQRAEGMGSVKDYTKTIATGLLEVGKTAFGIEDKKEKNSDINKKEDLKGTQNTNFNDDGFKVKEKENENINDSDAFAEFTDMIKSLNEDQKMIVLDILMPEEEIIENKIEEKEVIKTAEEETKEEKDKDINPENENTDENIQADNNN